MSPLGKRFLAFTLVLACAAACQPPERKTRKNLLARLRDARPASRIVALKELAHDPNREETAAIANSAKEATEDVRREIATTLGASKQPESVDLLGAMLRDSADSVRASAVKALEGKSGERAAAYASHAYENGGPKTRAAIAEGSPEIFRKGVEGEATGWRTRLETRRKDSRRQVQAAARAESGRDATPATIAALTASLSDPDPVMAAAAAAGLVNAQAVSAVPALTEALKSPAPLVVQAAAVALKVLGAQPAMNELLKTVETTRDETATHAMDALDGLPLNDAARLSLCHIATSHPDPGIALRAARLVGTTCALPSVLPAAAQEVAPRLLVLAALERKDPAVIKRARLLLDDPDARVATSAAAYLARCGEKADGALLVSKAQSQLAGLGRARASKSARAAAATNGANGGVSPEQMQMLQEFFGQASGQDLTKVPAPVNRLAEMLARRRSSADLQPVEDRPGALEFLAACSIAAARLGGSTGELVESLLASNEPYVRGLAADIAEETPGQDEALLARLRADADTNLQLRALLIDLAAERAGAVETVAKVLNEFDTEGRDRVARLLKPGKPESKALLLTLLEGDDIAAQTAARSLSTVAGPDVDAALIRAVGREGAGNVAAIVALRARPGAAVDAALAGAAVHPSADLRAFALQALVDRKGCSAAGKIGPLAADYSGVVRTAVAALQTTCGKH